MEFEYQYMEQTKNADYAIALKVRKVLAGEDFDESSSKFFGSPTLPASLLNAYPDDAFFLAQIRCEDLKDLDPEGRLPHEGYLYFFLDAEMYPNDDLYALLDHTTEEIAYIVDDFNDESPMGEGHSIPYAITFEVVDAGYDGTKLLGYPNNDVDDNDDRAGLLLQYDPLDFDVPFLSTCDGYAFFFFGEDPEHKFVNADYVVWGS